jgi:uncharacterized protein (UPF0335 family)
MTQLESLLEEKAQLLQDFEDVKNLISDSGYDLFLNRIDMLDSMIEIELNNV